jgi:hypothetical protein
LGSSRIARLSFGAKSAPMPPRHSGGPGGCPGDLGSAFAGRLPPVQRRRREFRFRDIVLREGRARPVCTGGRLGSVLFARHFYKPLTIAARPAARHWRHDDAVGRRQWYRVDDFRLAERGNRTQALFSDLPVYVHCLFPPLRYRGQPVATHRFSTAARLLRRRPAAGPAIDHFRHISAREAHVGRR